MMTPKGPSLWDRNNPQTYIRELPGIGSKLARRIIEDLGDGDAQTALGVLDRNPYSLTSVDGIGFKKADRVAEQAWGISSEDERRHEAGNRYILEQRGVLTERELTAERVKLELRDPEHLGAGLDIEEGLYWLPEELAAERGLEQWMRQFPAPPDPLPPLTATQLDICQHNGLDEVQTHAVQMALHTRGLALTGGAGCGKTHVVAALAQCLIAERRSVRGMAFAGKAADRMREAFDRYGVMAEASTIHKALGFQKGDFTTALLGEDLIVIDEASMLPNWLAWAVIKRLGPGSRIVLVGDPNQLPPIGYGTPFVDAIKSGVARAHLSRNYRQADQQGILHMAEGVLSRSRPAAAECVEMHLGVDPANLNALFSDLVRQHGGTNFEEWQVITYQNENAERFNLVAQSVINPDGQPLMEYPLWRLGTQPGSNRPKFKAEIRKGDKIIVVKNNGTLDIFNGQTGRVEGTVWKARERRDRVTGEMVESESCQHLRVVITGRAVDIPEDEVEKYLQLGYVITVHKAQGSDWPRVIVMQPGKVREDTARRFFYTAITRSKDHLVIVSTLTTVGWWTNAAADAPDVPSSLMRRLVRELPRCKSCGLADEHLDCSGDCWNCQRLTDEQVSRIVDGDSSWDEKGPASLPITTPDPNPLTPLVAAAGQKAVETWQELAQSPIVTPGDLSPAAWRALRQRPEMPGSVAPAVAERVAADVERVRREFAEMEVA